MNKIILGSDTKDILVKVIKETNLNDNSELWCLNQIYNLIEEKLRYPIDRIIKDKVQRDIEVLKQAEIIINNYRKLGIDISFFKID